MLASSVSSVSSAVDLHPRLHQHRPLSAAAGKRSLSVGMGPRRGLGLGNQKRPSIIDVAEACGLLELSPSDLVYETSVFGACYYDFVLSSSLDSPVTPGGATLYLARFDANTNLESLDTTHVPPTAFTETHLPRTDVALALLGMLTWREQLCRSRVLCLVRNLDSEAVGALDVLKKVAAKLKCLHHVSAGGSARQSSSPGSFALPQSASRLLFFHDTPTVRANEGMRLRVLLCQTRSISEKPPSNTVREAKALLEPSSNPLLCLCFSLS